MTQEILNDISGCQYVGPLFDGNGLFFTKKKLELIGISNARY